MYFTTKEILNERNMYLFVFICHKTYNICITLESGDTMIKYDTFQSYMNAQTGKGKEMLQTLKDIIVEAVPSAYETMGYGVPAYGLIENAKLNEKIMIANFKNHVSFYPHPDTIESFKEDLKEYTCLKGTVQISHTQDIPKELFKKMILYRYNAIEKK